MPRWTSKQKEALEYEGSVLVRAAAGSGKTSVLTAKVAEIMAQKKAKLDEILVVTFTKAAANEMKERIIKRLSQSEDTEVKKAALNISSADINTLHGFCFNVVKENYEALGLAPSPFALTEAETDIILKRVYDEIAAQYYDNGDEDFLRLVARYGEFKDEELKKKLLKLYEELSAVEDMGEWLKAAAEKCEKEETYEEMRCALEEDAIIRLEGIINAFETSLKLCEEAGLDKMAAVEADNIEIARANLELLKEEGRAAYVMRRMAFKRANYGKGVSPEEKELIDYVRKTFAMEREKALFEKLMNFGAYEKFLSEGKELKRDILSIRKVLMSVEEEFLAQKKALNALDFSDMEHMALKVLKNEHMRIKYLEKYKYVFVDEYQDTSDIQEAIINAIAEKSKLFLVGDLKQSIYSFRGAEPRIFAERSKRYEEENKKIVSMNDNFRSAKEVIDVINDVFYSVMSEQTGGVAYNEEEALIAKAEKLPGEVSVLIADTSEKIYLEERALTASEVEAAAVADKVRALLKENIEKEPDDEMIEGESSKERKTRPGDIAIILRKKAGDRLADYARALDALGIPVYCPGSEAQKDMMEMKVFINLLKLIDNPAQDIELASVMSFPLFDFSANELADIRIKHKEGSFYDAAISYSKEKNDELSKKLNDFFGMLERLRLKSMYMPISSFLLYVDRETKFSLYLCSLKEGEDKEMYFLNRICSAAQIGQAASNNINEFLKHLEQSEFKEGEEKKDKTRVNIMTIHKSKGLEFPVVIIAGMGNGHQKKQEKECFYIEQKVRSGI